MFLILILLCFLSAEVFCSSLPCYPDQWRIFIEDKGVFLRGTRYQNACRKKDAIYCLGQNRSLFLHQGHSKINFCIYLNGEEEWRVSLSDQGICCKYRAESDAFLACLNHKVPADFLIKQLGQDDQRVMVGAFQGISRGIYDDRGHGFYQKFVENGYVFTLFPILRGGELDIDIALSFHSSTHLLCHALEGVRSRHRKLIPRCPMGSGPTCSGSTPQRQQDPIVERKQYTPESPTETSMAWRMLSVAGGIKVSYPQTLDVTPNQAERCMHICRRGEDFYLYAQLFAGFAIFSLKHKDTYDAAVGVMPFDCAPPLRINTEESNVGGVSEVYLHLPRGAHLSVALRDKNSFLVKQVDVRGAYEVPTAWSFASIAHISQSIVDERSTASFNYTGAPVARFVNDWWAAILCQNVVSRKLYVSSAFFVGIEGDQLTLFYKSLRHKQYAMSANILKEKLDNPVNIRDCVARLDRKKSLGTFSWKDWSLMVVMSKQVEGQIIFRASCAGRVRCEGFLSVPGNIENYLIFKKADEECVHAYIYSFNIEGTKAPEDMHITFLDEARVIDWNVMRTQSALLLLFDMFPPAGQTRSTTVSAELRVGKDKYSCSLCVDGLKMNPIYFSGKFVGEELVLPTHYRMRWNERLELEFIHRLSKSSLISLGKIYMDAFCKAPLKKDGQPNNSLSVLIDGAEGKKHVFWITPK